MLYTAGSKRKLHFIAVGAPDARSSADTKNRRTVRAHVMQDYLRQKTNPEWKMTSPTVPSPISSHMSRFRSSMPPVRAKESVRRKKTRLDSRYTPKPEQRPLIPAPLHPEDHVEQHQRETEVSPHDLDMLDAFRIASIDLTDSDTLSLLQYYYTSFWANSYACNPEESWINVAMMDSATMHSTLTLVAIHRRDRFSIDLSKVYFRHRGRAMNIIASRLNDPTESLSDATIGAVAILSTSDNEFDWPRAAQLSHSAGLAKLVALRGGIEALSTNRHVQRVVAWADLLQSAMHGIELQAEIPSSMDLLESIEPEPALGTSGMHNSVPSISLRGLPPNIAKTIQQLRVLAALKTALLIDRSQTQCKMFSDLLWKVEHDILQRRQAHSVVDENDQRRGLLGQEVMATAVGIGALIFSYSTLRDLASPIVFRRLSDDLKDCLSAMQGYSHILLLEKEPLASKCLDERDDDKAAVSLWLLYLGWKAVSGEDIWFAKQAVELCLDHGDSSRDWFLRKIQSVILQTQEVSLTVDDFWHAVEEFLWSESSLPARDVTGWNRS